MGLPEGFTIRRASTDDVITLVEHRREMFYDMGYRDDAALDSMAAKFKPWLLGHMNSGDCTWRGSRSPRTLPSRQERDFG
jgi:hypothetical protein